MKLEKIDGQYRVTYGKFSSFKKLECESCPLFQKLRIEPDLGEYQQILAVGEGPGAEERLKMLFFTGPSGSYLREVVRDTGAGKFGVGYLNILYCEGGKRLEFDDPDALWEAINLCTKLYLFPDIDRLKPKLVVPLGNYPKSVILPGERKGIGGCAGLLYPEDCKEKVYGTFDVIPLHHPAHIIRNPKMGEMYWDEWNEVRLHFTRKPGPFVTKVVLPGEAKKTLEKLKGLSELAIDFETTSFHPWDSGEFMVDFEQKVYNMGDIICLSVNGDGLNSFVFTKDILIKHKTTFKQLFESKGVVCYNGQFDILFLKKIGINPKLVDDPMLMSYSMDESPSHPLKRLSRRYLGLDDWSEELESYPDKAKSYAFIPKDKLLPYCGMDTAATIQIKSVLSSRMDEDDRKIYNKILIPCANMVLDLGYHGIRVDVGRLMELKRTWEKRRFGLSNKLKSYGIRNAKSPYQISSALLKYQVVDYDAVTAKSNLNRLAKECEESGNTKGAELCTMVVDYRELSKALDTVLYDIASSMSDNDCKIHPDAKQFGTVTGRWVYSNPSLLNFPHATRLSEELRTVLIPDEGFIWGHRDQKQFEMRIYAVVNNDEKLLGIFSQGRDPHAEVGAYYYHNVLGFPEGMKKYLEENSKSKGYIRVAIKACNFGTIYGRGVESIADQWGIAVREATNFRKAILEFAPDIQLYWKRVEATLNKDQVIVNPFGRKRRFPILAEVNYHECKLQAWNFGIQSTANDCNLIGMYNMWDSPYKSLLMPFFPVHDCIEYQEEERHAGEIEQWLSEMLATVPAKALNTTSMKFETDGGLGYDWAEASLDHKCEKCGKDMKPTIDVKRDQVVLWKCKCGYTWN